MADDQYAMPWRLRWRVWTVCATQVEASGAVWSTVGHSIHPEELAKSTISIQAHGKLTASLINLVEEIHFCYTFNCSVASVKKNMTLLKNIQTPASTLILIFNNCFQNYCIINKYYIVADEKCITMIKRCRRSSSSRSRSCRSSNPNPGTPTLTITLTLVAVVVVVVVVLNCSWIDVSNTNLMPPPKRLCFHRQLLLSCGPST